MITPCKLCGIFFDRSFLTENTCWSCRDEKILAKYQRRKQTIKDNYIIPDHEIGKRVKKVEDNPLVTWIKKI